MNLAHTTTKRAKLLENHFSHFFNNVHLAIMPDKNDYCFIKLAAKSIKTKVNKKQIENAKTFVLAWLYGYGEGIKNEC